MAAQKCLASQHALSGALNTDKAQGTAAGAGNRQMIIEHRSSGRLVMSLLNQDSAQDLQPLRLAIQYNF